VSGGGQSAAWCLRYQYLRTIEALMSAVEEPSHGVVAVHVEGLPREGEWSSDGIDYELTDADQRVLLAVKSKHEHLGPRWGPERSSRR
jgi:hypothetical protein